jgi:hypothetical protein
MHFIRHILQNFIVLSQLLSDHLTHRTARCCFRPGHVIRFIMIEDHNLSWAQSSLAPLIRSSRRGADDSFLIRRCAQGRYALADILLRGREVPYRALSGAFFSLSAAAAILAAWRCLRRLFLRRCGDRPVRAESCTRFQTLYDKAFDAFASDAK